MVCTRHQRGLSGSCPVDIAIQAEADPWTHIRLWPDHILFLILHCECIFRFRLFFGRKRKFIFRLFLFYGRKCKIHFRSASTGSRVSSIKYRPKGMPTFRLAGTHHDLFTQPPSGRRLMRICFLQLFFCFFCILFFFCFFLFFFRPPKLWDNRSRERLNGLSWNFHQTIGLKCSLKRRATAWRKSCRRLANGEC